MRSGHQIEEVFQTLRTRPTELSLEQVEHLITTLPAIPWWKNWLHYFNLNSILMSAIAISIAVASMFLPTKAEQEVQITIPALDPIEYAVTPQNIQLLPQAEPERPQVAILVASKELEEDTFVELSASEERETNIEEAYTTEIIEFTPALDLLELPKALPRFQPEPELVAPGCAPIPHQNSREIRQFKQDLLQSLQEDHLIHSIRQNVLVEVPDGEIWVNGQKLNKNLFSKYADFLYANVPPCQGRYLVISRRFFGAGSYTKDGYFKGLSINAEHLPGLNEFKASIFPEAEVHTAMTSGQTLVRSSAAVKGATRSVVMLEQEELKANTILPLLEWPRVRRLKKKLVSKLLKDKLMSKLHKKAIVGLYKDKVVVNGKAVDKALEDSYRNLLVASFGINSGDQREIHIAPKFIMIGDFGDYGEMLRGQSHGKSMIVGKTRPSGLYADDGFRRRHNVKRWE